jgi:cysteinyl-tRNA synthetase
LLSVHYRQKLNFTFASIEQAAAALRRIDDLRFRLAHAAQTAASSDVMRMAAERLKADFSAGLRDDLNVSAALAAVFGFVRKANASIEEGRVGAGDREIAARALREVDAVLGVLHQEDWTPAGEGSRAAGLGDVEIEALVAEREGARRARDFRRSDAIRDQLRDGGVLVEDTASGPRWRRE